MAQQARPHWYTHSEYERPRLNSVVSGLGMRPLSTRPMRSHPAQHALAPRVHEAEEQDEHEDAHLDQPEAGRSARAGVAHGKMNTASTSKITNSRANM